MASDQWPTTDYLYSKQFVWFPANSLKNTWIGFARNWIVNVKRGIISSWNATKSTRSGRSQSASWRRSVPNWETKIVRWRTVKRGIRLRLKYTVISPYVHNKFACTVGLKGLMVLRSLYHFCELHIIMHIIAIVSKLVDFISNLFLHTSTISDSYP